MNNITLSIIIPTFNVAKTLEECLKSIICQSNGNFEVLIMDGYSNDDTLQIARSFEDDRIRIYSEPDKGIYDAMNKGIDLAKGEWLYFLGSDDTFYNNEVFQKIALISQHEDAKIIYGNVLMNNTREIYCGAINNVEILFKNICQQAIFYKKTVFDNLKFDIKYKVFADHDLNIKLYDKYYSSLYFQNLTIARYCNQGFSSTNTDAFVDDVVALREKFTKTKCTFFLLRYNLFVYQQSLKPSRFRGILWRFFNLLSK